MSQVNTRLRNRTVVRVLALLRSRAPALLVAVGVVLGEAGAWFLPEHVLMGIVVALGGGCFLARASLRLFIVTVLLGVTVGEIVTRSVVSAPSAEDAIVLVQVEDSPRHPKTGEVVFVGRSLLDDAGGRLRCRAVDLPWREASLLQKGDVVWVRGKLAPVQREVNPFSWSSSLWRRGIASECDVHYVSSALLCISAVDDQLRERFKGYVVDSGGDRRGTALFLSIAFGFQDLLSDYVEQAFRTLGMTHLLVVSGFQVSLVFLWASWMVGCVIRLVLGRRVRMLAQLGGVVITGAYVCLLGGDISIIRAFVAVVMVFISGTRERSRSFLQRWAAALVLVEIVWPFSFFDPGVQLTFAALAGIGVGRYLGRRSTPRECFWIAVCVWLYTSMILLPRTGFLSFAGLVINPLLAGGASVLNCIGGAIALAARAVGVDTSAILLRGLVWGNELFAELVVAAASVPQAGVTVEDPIVIVGVEVVMVVLSMLTLGKAARETRWGVIV